LQTLLSESALARVADRLPAGLDVLTFGTDGIIRRGGVVVDGADPEVFWVSLDLFISGQMPAFFGQMMRGSHGKWAQLFSAGIDNPGFKALMAKGIRLSKSSAQAPTIAEYVMSHALSILHPVAEQRRAQEAHEWRRIFFREVASTRWLMLGMGAIGTEIARRLQPFGAPLTVVRRNPAPDPLAEAVHPTSELLRLLPDADVVILACALTEETRGIAGAPFFAAMKPGSRLINIGRGALIDDDALKAGLEHDQPAQAVLDVFHTEPLPGDSWFWDHPKVHVTAHCSSAGDGTLKRGDALFLENLRRYRAGETLLNEAHKSEVGL
jgi:phosphoglycerate dehydrogenase-like enzyme